MGIRTVVISAVIILLLGIGAGLFYFYFHEEPAPKPLVQEMEEGIIKNYTYLRVFYPVGGRTEIFEKKVPGIMTPLEIAQKLVEEYIRIAHELDTGIVPPDTRLNNIFISGDGIVYLDFNSALSKNFTGDVIDEYMLLKSIFDTMVSNLDIEDVVILVNHREIESIGGHLFANRPLKGLVAEAYPQEAYIE